MSSKGSSSDARSSHVPAAWPMINFVPAESSNQGQQQSSSSQQHDGWSLGLNRHTLPKHVHATACSGNSRTPAAELSQLSNFDRVRKHNSSDASGNSGSRQQHNPMPNEALGATDSSNNADVEAWSWDDWQNPPPESSGGGSSSGGYGDRWQ